MEELPKQTGTAQGLGPGSNPVQGPDAMHRGPLGLENLLSRLVVGGLLGFAAAIAFVQYVLRDNPREHTVLTIVGAVCLALAAVAFPTRPRWRTLEIDGGRLRLGRLFGSSVTVPASEVFLLVAEGGLDFSGGELILWKKIVILEPTGTHTLWLQPNQCLQAMRDLEMACPRAMVVRFNGRADLPLFDDDGDARQWAETCGPRIHDAVAALMRGTTAIAASLLVLAAGAAALGVLAWRAGRLSDSTRTMPLIWCVILVASAFVLFGRALQWRRLGRAVWRSLEQLRDGRAAPAAAATLDLATAPDGFDWTPSARGPLGPAMAPMALAGLLLLWLPVLGPLLLLVPYRAARGRAGTTAWLIRAQFGLACVVTTAFIVAMAMVLIGERQSR